MYGKKGTITVFLSLISILFLSLFCTITESARAQGARFQAACAFDMGLFSIFGAYDRVLLEEYDLWALDCGKEKDSVKEVLEKELERYIQPNLQPQKGQKVRSTWNLFPVDIQETTVDKYAFLSDESGQVFYTQIVENQKEQILGETLSDLKQKMKEIKSGNEKGKQYEKEEKLANDAYKKAEQEQKNQQQTAETESEIQPETEYSSNIEKQPKNLLEQIKKIKKKGILSLVMKDPEKVSDKKAERSDFPSERKLEKGNLTVKKQTASAVSEAVFLKYLGDVFTCASDKEKQSKERKHKFSYELEYILAGKSSDEENLKKAVHRILLLREGTNYVYLSGDSKKKAEAMELAAVIAGAAAVPELTRALQKLILIAWAYGESILDVRMLLAGGKTGVIKNEKEWKLSLQDLGNLEEILKNCDEGKGSEDGISYRDYLIGILALEQKRKRNLRALDLIEANRRMENGGENFRVDTWIVQAEASAVFELTPVFFYVPAVWMKIRNQGTSYEICGQYGYMEGGV